MDRDGRQNNAWTTTLSLALGRNLKRQIFKANHLKNTSIGQLSNWDADTPLPVGNRHLIRWTLKHKSPHTRAHMIPRKTISRQSPRNGIAIASQLIWDLSTHSLMNSYIHGLNMDGDHRTPPRKHVTYTLMHIPRPVSAEEVARTMAYRVILRNIGLVTTLTFRNALPPNGVTYSLPFWQ